MEQKNAPAKKFAASGVEVCIWENKSEKGTYQTISFQRSYKDKDGSWKTTQSLRTTDLPILTILLNEAYREIKLKNTDANGGLEELNP